MENNPIHPDEMDRLLRDTFLDSDFPESEKITDLMARQAFSTSWATVPPVHQEMAFVAKKGFWAGFSLNVWIVAAVLIAAGTGIYLYTREGAQQNRLQAAPSLAHTLSLPPIPELFAPLTVEKPVRHPAPVPPKPQAQTPVVVDTVPAQKPARNNGGTPLPKPRPGRYVLIPDITPAEALANEKRKQEMLRQIIKQDKKEWVYIPMGTTHLNERAVSVQAFFMQAHEVSNVQYRTFLYDLVLNDHLLEYEKAAVYDSAWLGMGGMESMAKVYFWHPKFDNYPVVNISPEGAQLYCNWLTRAVNKALDDEGKTLINDLRVPSEEEWIYAAKADNDSAVYAWDGIYLRNRKGLPMANSRRTGNAAEDDNADITAPVNAYFPNAWGLYNMCGNVAEMMFPTSNNQVLVKGGAWTQPADKMRLLETLYIPLQKMPMPSVGFRPVFTVLQPQ